MALIMAIEEEIEALEENHTPTVGDFDFVFEDELLPQHKCPICLLAMRNPVQTKCGHRFCESCLLESFTSARCVFGVFWVSAGFATCRVRYVRVRYMFATRITVRYLS